jgi:tetratricopeptide (TPR) repeat protein
MTNDAFRSGLRLFRAGRLTEAVAQLEPLVRAAPGHIEARHVLAICYYRLRRFTDAEPLFREVLERKGGSHDVWFYLGLTLEQRQHWTEACRCYREAYARRSRSAQAVAATVPSRRGPADATPATEESVPRADRQAATATDAGNSPSEPHRSDDPFAALRSELRRRSPMRGFVIAAGALILFAVIAPGGLRMLSLLLIVPVLLVGIVFTAVTDLRRRRRDAEPEPPSPPQFALANHPPDGYAPAYAAPGSAAASGERAPVGDRGREVHSGRRRISSMQFHWPIIVVLTIATLFLPRPPMQVFFSSVQGLMSVLLVLVLLHALLYANLTSWRIYEHRIDLSEGLLLRRHVHLWLYEIRDSDVSSNVWELLTNNATLELKGESKTLTIRGMARRSEVMAIWDGMRNAIREERGEIKRIWI